MSCNAIYELLVSNFSESYLGWVALAFIVMSIYQIFKPSSDFSRSRLLDSAFAIAFLLSTFLIIVIASAVFGFIPEWLGDKTKEIGPLISAFGILTGASLASLGVLKTIANTQKIEADKLKREIDKNKNMLRMILINTSAMLHKFKDKRPGEIRITPHDIEILKEIYKSLIDKDLLSILDKEDENAIFQIYNLLIKIVKLLDARATFSNEREEGETYSEQEKSDVYVTDFSNTAMHFIDEYFRKNYPLMIEKD